MVRKRKPPVQVVTAEGVHALKEENRVGEGAYVLMRWFCKNNQQHVTRDVVNIERK
jgi:hypothetical protein